MLARFISGDQHSCEIVLLLAPTEVKFDFLKSSFFVVAVFLWPKRAVIKKMHREATRTPPHGHLGEGWRTNFFYFSNILRKKYFYSRTLLNSNKKTSGVKIDLSWYVTVLKQSLNFKWGPFVLLTITSSYIWAIGISPFLFHIGRFWSFKNFFERI